MPIEKADFSINTPGPKGVRRERGCRLHLLLEPIGGNHPEVLLHAPGRGSGQGEIRRAAASEWRSPGRNRRDSPARRARLPGRPHEPGLRSVRCRGCPPLPQQALQCLEKDSPPTLCLQGAAPDRIVTLDHALIERPLEGRQDRSDQRPGLDVERARQDRSRTKAARPARKWMRFAWWPCCWRTGTTRGRISGSCVRRERERPDGSCRTPIAAITRSGRHVRSEACGPRQLEEGPDLDRSGRVPGQHEGSAVRRRDVRRGADLRGRTAVRAEAASPPDAAAAEHALRSIRRGEASGGSSTRATSRNAWTDAFLEKVKQIASAGPCPQRRSARSSRLIGLSAFSSGFSFRALSFSRLADGCHCWLPAAKRRRTRRAPGPRFGASDTVSTADAAAS